MYAIAAMRHLAVQTDKWPHYFLFWTVLRRSDLERTAFLKSYPKIKKSLFQKLLQKKNQTDWSILVSWWYFFARGLVQFWSLLYKSISLCKANNTYLDFATTRFRENLQIFLNPQNWIVSHIWYTDESKCKQNGNIGSLNF